MVDLLLCWLVLTCGLLDWLGYEFWGVLAELLVWVVLNLDFGLFELLLTVARFVFVVSCVLS